MTSPQIDTQFPSVLLGGFECATHIGSNRRRVDYVTLTDHERQFRQDYERARSLGIRTIREGLRWYLIDRGGRYDFSSIEPMVKAGVEMGIVHIHCLFHYGYPEDLDPLSNEFVERFRDFAAAFARWRVPRVPGPRWYGPANEPSMFAFAGGEAGWFAPFHSDKTDELKINLVRAALAATDAIRAEDPEARFIAIDPVINIVPSAEVLDSESKADQRNESQYLFWDMLVGRQMPELGGKPGYLDLVGINAYPESHFDVSGQTLPMDDSRRRPMRDILEEMWNRYRRPVLIAETSARRSQRPQWIRMIAEEYVAALEAGVDLQGICLYPLVDMPEWKKGEIGPLGQLGLWDVVHEGETLRRVLNHAYHDAVLEAKNRIESAHVRLKKSERPIPKAAEQAPQNGRRLDGPQRNARAHDAEADSARTVEEFAVPAKN